LAALPHLNLALEIRDITTQETWFQRYQYEIPVLCRVIETPDGEREEALPRLSPRAPVSRLEQMLQTYLAPDTAK
ncbi:MAG: glutaredoxin family protein, partial [Cyanobacteria bacterium P01_H01_bin.153]